MPHRPVSCRSHRWTMLLDNEWPSNDPQTCTLVRSHCFAAANEPPLWHINYLFKKKINRASIQCFKIKCFSISLYQYFLTPPETNDEQTNTHKHVLDTLSSNSTGFLLVTDLKVVYFSSILELCWCPAKMPLSMNLHFRSSLLSSQTPVLSVSLKDYLHTWTKWVWHDAV